GIVTAGAGRGGVTRGMNEALNRAMQKGVIVVAGSRTGSGSVPVGTGMRRDGKTPTSIGAGDLNVQKARVLLMLALTRTSDAGAIAKIFAERQ
ncbi:MAG TPA: L-asparaginase, partial [Gemmatimonadaceae bacterium]